MKTIKLIIISCLLLAGSKVVAQWGNTYPYPQNGNVGIGTVNVNGYKLTAASSLENTFQQEIGYQNGITPFRILAEDYSINEPPPGVFNSQFLAEGLIFQNGENPSSADKVFSLDRKGSLFLGPNSNTNYNTYMFNYGLVSDLSIYSLENIYAANKIGVGTTSPASGVSLDVRGLATINSNKLLLKDGNSSSSNYLKYHVSYYGYSINGVVLSGDNGGALANSTGGVLYWNQNGDVGIGTAQPAFKLDIHGGDVQLNSKKLLLANDGVNSYHYLGFNHSFGNPNNNDGPVLAGYHSGILGTTHPNEKSVLYWNHLGKVGINTTSPNQALEVNGWVKIDGEAFTDDEIQFETHDGFHRIAFEEIRFHEWSHGDKLTLTNGYVGVNTINPTEQLEVNGAIKSSRASADNALLVWNSTDNEIDFMVKGDGRVFAREVEVKLSTFPDYVFENTYNLMPFENLRTFINQEKHLPGVKSATMVEKEGYGLGELSRIQMEKIEELTLYILELEERIKKLEAVE